MAKLRVPLVAFIALIVVGINSLSAFAGEQKADRHTFTLWQLPSQTPSQMLSYVIQTVHGKMIVIDGGMSEDAPYLSEFLAKRGGEVTAWFITHPHDDHIRALTSILNNRADLKIGRIYASLPSEEFIKQYEPQTIENVSNFNKALCYTHKVAINLVLGAQFDIDQVRINVLGIRNPEITANPINNSSVVLRVSDSSKSMIFLADLSVEGGEKLLHGKYKNLLKADYVQMAHHGQNGVNKDVYEIIRPSFCMWTTPQWLWDNDSGQGKGSGTWLTLQVRQWMEDLGVKHNYVMKDGLCRIE